MRLGYLVPEFPSQTHIFFWREIEALRIAGEDMFLLSTKRPSSSVTRHEFASIGTAQTRYLFPPSAKAWVAWALGGGLSGLAAGLSYIKQIEDRGWRNRVKYLGLLASAINLVSWARENKIDHIHGHSCANSAHLLAMARRMGGPPYSLTLHGNLDVYGTDHRLKMADAKVVFVVGTHLREQLLRIGVPGDRIVTTFISVDTPDWPLWEQGEVICLACFDWQPSLVWFQGKGIFTPSQRPGGWSEYKLYAGGGFYESAIVSKVDELRLSDCVEMTGTLSETEVYSELSNADAFVLSSTGAGEAWPVSVMEAM
jgi:glycosyltransferase involved in cell wall biosynthesis